MVIVNAALMERENKRGIDADFNGRMEVESIEWEDDADMEMEFDDGD